LLPLDWKEKRSRLLKLEKELSVNVNPSVSVQVPAAWRAVRVPSVQAGAAWAEGPKARIKDPDARRRLRRGLDWVSMDEMGKLEKVLSDFTPVLRQDTCGLLISFDFVGFDRSGPASARIPAGRLLGKQGPIPDPP